MMNYMLLLYADESAGAALSSDVMAEAMTQLFAYQAALEKAEAFVATAPLARTHEASTVQVRDGKVVIGDGPYAETREQLGGYFIIRAADDDEARLWASRCPAATWGTIEVRAILDLANLEP